MPQLAFLPDCAQNLDLSWAALVGTATVGAVVLAAIMGLFTRRNQFPVEGRVHAALPARARQDKDCC